MSVDVEVPDGDVPDPPTSPDDPADGARRHGREVPRFVWPTLVAVGFLALIGAALLRPGGSVQAARTEAIPTSADVLPVLLPGFHVEQRFTAMDDGLSAVTTTFATYRAEPTCTLAVSLLDEDGASVGGASIPCAGIVDGARTPVIAMDPIEGSGGREYRLVFDVSVEPSSGLGIGAAPVTEAVPAAVANGAVQDRSVAIITDYGDDRFAANQVAIALDRMGQYGPAWHHPAFFVLLVLACGAALAAMALAPWRTALVLLVAFTVAKGLLWAAVVPLGHGVDEGAHIAHAQFLAVDHRIPKLGQPIDGPQYSETLGAAGSVFRPQWAIRSDRPPFAANGEEPPGRSVLDAAIGNDHSNGNTPASAYSPAYYLVPAAIYQLVPGTLDVKVGWMRLWSIALGAVTVVAAAFLGRRLFPDQTSVALVFAVAVSLQPMITAQTSVINNDALLIAVGAVCLLAGVALTDPRRDWRWPLVAGLAFGTTLLCKPLGAAFGPVLLIAFVIGRVRGARALAWWKEVGLAALGFFVTYGWWFVFAAVRGYAGLTINEDVPGENRGVTDLLRLQSAGRFEAARALWTDQFWGRFDWANQAFPPKVLAIITVACVLGGVLLAVYVVTSVLDAVKKRRRQGPWMVPAGADLAASAAVLLLAVVVTVTQLYVVLYQYFHRTGSGTLISGRYALMVAPAVLVLPVLALRRLVPRLPPLVPMTIIAVAMAVLNVIGYGLLVERYYL